MLLQCLIVSCHLIDFSVTVPRGSHPFPSRTRKLSLSGPMVLRGRLRGRLGRRRDKTPISRKACWGFSFYPLLFHSECLQHVSVYPVLHTRISGASEDHPAGYRWSGCPLRAAEPPFAGTPVSWSVSHQATYP